MRSNDLVFLIDGAFFEQRFKALNNKRSPSAEDVQKLVHDTLNQIRTIRNNQNIDLLRVYYYDCPPFEGEVPSHDRKKKINFSGSEFVKKKKEFLYQLKMKSQFALRLGKLNFNGWKVNFYKENEYLPDFRQKSVDMKIGLDMAWISSKSKVKGIVLIAGDSDFITPMKWVRKEGILVYLCLMKHKKYAHELKEHSDFVLE